MDILAQLSLGFGVALTPANLFYCFLGVAFGTLIGVLPGLGPVATIAMLLPLTFKLEPVAALIMLAGIYYGAQYGGSTTAILVNLPGEPSSIVTAMDGYRMARIGRAGTALSAAALASFFAGTVATVLLVVAAPLLSAIAFKFGAAEIFSLMVLGLVGATVLAHGSLIKAIGMTMVGLILGLIGVDTNSGTERFAYGFPQLVDGLNFVVVAMGFFGIADIIANLEQQRRTQREIVMAKIGRLYPNRAELKSMVRPILRGTGLGALFGVLPGGGPVLAAFSSYALEKKLAADPSRFGKGAIEGVAAPEAANNAAAQTSFIPLLTLGIPPNAVMALMVGAMLIHGIQPGPSVMTVRPELFWGLIASMWIGNLMLVILNLPLVGLWVQLLKLPYRFLFPSIVVFCCIGAYTLSFARFDVFLMGLLGIVGCLLAKLRCEPIALMLGYVLGPMMEENFRRALEIGRGDWSVFVTRPISLGLLLLAVLWIGMLVVPAIRRRRGEVFAEDR